MQKKIKNTNPNRNLLLFGKSGTYPPFVPPPLNPIFRDIDNGDLRKIDNGDLRIVNL